MRRLARPTLGVLVGAIHESPEKPSPGGRWPGEAGSDEGKSVILSGGRSPESKDLAAKPHIAPTAQRFFASLRMTVTSRFLRRLARPTLGILVGAIHESPAKAFSWRRRWPSVSEAGCGGLRSSIRIRRNKVNIGSCSAHHISQPSAASFSSRRSLRSLSRQPFGLPPSPKGRAFARRLGGSPR